MIIYSWMFREKCIGFRVLQNQDIIDQPHEGFTVELVSERLQLLGPVGVSSLAASRLFNYTVL